MPLSYADDTLIGYRIQVKRALWERVKSFGVPRIVGSLWFTIWLLVTFMLAVLVGVKWVVLPIGLWLLGQGVMMWLTALDPYWDDVILAQLARRYKARYGAG